MAYRLLNGPDMRHDSLKILILCMLVASPIAYGQVYKFIDENGNVTYSDTPPADKQDMQPAELPDIFYQPAVEVPELPRLSDIRAQDINVSINSPEEGTTILGRQTSFSASASTSRTLSNGEQARLIVNGAPHSTGTALSWSITALIRGQYTLAVEIIDKDGKTIASSEIRSFFVKRNIAR